MGFIATLTPNPLLCAVHVYFSQPTFIIISTLLRQHLISPYLVEEQIVGVADICHSPINTPGCLTIQFYINSPIGELTSILTMPIFTCTLFAYQIAYNQVSHIHIFSSTVCVI